MKIVKDINIKRARTPDQLVKQFYEAGGFTAKKIGLGVDILKEMIKDKSCVKFLSFPACIISTGTRGVIRYLVKEKLVDVIITTSGTLDHDFARVWKNYYHGSFMMDDIELHKKGINRLGNVLVPNEAYGEILEDKVQPLLKKLYSGGKKELSSKEFIWELGKSLEKEKNKRTSIIYWAWKNKIPIFVPGITDGAVGSQIWLFAQKRPDFRINLIKDESDLANIVFDAKKASALMIGGGISKHHTIWWAQFRGGLDYAVYITTAVEWDGSLSGAKTREAISWGKLKERAKHITIEGDATVLLPLMIAALRR